MFKGAVCRIDWQLAEHTEMEHNIHNNVLVYNPMEIRIVVF